MATAQAAQNQPNTPPQPSSTAPVHTLTIPVGSSIASTSSGQIHRTASTSSLSSAAGSPGCTRYQWPSSIASVIAPRNAAPTRVRSSATVGFPPASRPAATRPTTPMATGTRSRAGGYSGPAGRVDAAAGAGRSIPVIAATRAVRRSCSARCPRTPARRRATDTTSPTTHPAATPSAAASRTGTTPKATPAANAPSAMAR